MLDPLQYYLQVLCNGMKTRFRMVMIAHPGPGIGFHKRFMWRIIIPPTPVSRVPPRQRNSNPKPISHSVKDFVVYTFSAAFLNNSTIALILIGFFKPACITASALVTSPDDIIIMSRL